MNTSPPRAATFTFAELPPFTKALSSYLSDDDYAGLQTYIAMNPQAGDVIPASAGCRTLRWLLVPSRTLLRSSGHKAALCQGKLTGAGSD